MSDTPTDSTGNRLLTALRSFDRRVDAWAGAISAWEGIFIGATTILVAEIVTDALPLPEFYRALALFPVTLVVVYGQLALFARYGC
jgi:hypothetical protein